MKLREIIKNLAVMPVAATFGNDTTSLKKTKHEDEWTPRKEAIPGEYPTISPLNICIRSGHLVFLSGIGGWYANRRKEPGDIKVHIASALTDINT